MIRKNNESRTIWLVAGLVVGMGVSYFWPHEPAMAIASDRNDRFALLTCPTGGNHEAVFVLDFLTGRLTGAGFDRTGSGFAWRWYRNIAEDFKVDPESTPNYAITSGIIELPRQAGITFGTSLIYIAEMSSGRVQAYAFPFKPIQSPVPPVELIPVDKFEFREAALNQ